MVYPEYVDGQPPIISLREYDTAPWAKDTAIDRKDSKYVIVEMTNPDHIVASIPQSDYATLDEIFQSAHATHAKDLHDKK
ncbi:hypothetical protein CLIB1444_05S07074 [[Candida] jaroonii]|uniref:Uncharacterized protein n=1 Tax=[Candida] jaroonii TaxID=467808 RepID=A0ACA9Y9C5_9ASCO|nr:hypothetical protein CLIB1444_05S07074 [[Candida] jaroonii]